MKIKPIAFALLFALLFAVIGAVIAFPPGRAYIVYQFTGDDETYAGKMFLWRLWKTAVMRDAKAQCHLGETYRHGRADPHDAKAAVKWFRKAAEQGYADAQSWLGLMYRNGEGVARDAKTAAEWFHKAAVEWFLKAAKRGHVGAEYQLGWMYENGRGVPKDEKAAAEWYRKVVDRDGVSTDAEEALERLEEACAPAASF